MNLMRNSCLLLAVLAGLGALPACQKMEPETADPSVIEQPELPPTEAETAIFAAATEGRMTKTELSDNGDDTYTLRWQEGDAIDVNGKTLSLLTTDQPAGYGPGETWGYFAGPAPTPRRESPRYTACYPASLHVGSYYSLPSAQTYVADNVAAFPMFAENDGDSFVFRNLCGIIRLGLKGDSRNIASISLADMDTDPKALSGRFTVSEHAAVMAAGTGGTALHCSPAVPLNTESFTCFNITVPAATYGRLRIIIEASDGELWTLTSKSGITVERSQITTINLSSPKFKDTRHTITYTTSDGNAIAKFAASDDASVFGEGLRVVSHEYTDGLGTIVL
ncbi:MAG: hypothetical protein J5871_02905, partial [Bacteroidales bacterium]|nr:hypothetical protein [Bacteroidales bacterium]